MKKFIFILIYISLLVIPVLSQKDIDSVSDRLFDLQRNGKYDEAIADISQLVESEPNNPNFYIKRAEFFGLKNQLDDALADTSKAIEVEPDNADFYIERAIYFNRAKNSQAVLKDVKTAFSLNSDSGSILIRGTNLLRSTENFEENVKITDSFIADNKFVYWAYKIRSENKKFLKDYKGALEDSIKSIEMLNLNIEVSNELRPISSSIEFGRLTLFSSVIIPSLTELKNDKSVFNYYVRLIDLLKVNADGYYEQELQREIKMRGSASENTFYTAYSNLTRLITSCSNLYIEKGLPEKGDEVLNELISIKQTWRGFSDRALIYQERGKYKEAIDDLTQIIKMLKQPPPHIYYQRGDLYMLNKQFDLAIADYETVKRFYKDADKKILSARQKLLESNSKAK